MSNDVDRLEYHETPTIDVGRDVAAEVARAHIGESHPATIIVLKNVFG